MFYANIIAYERKMNQGNLLVLLIFDESVFLTIFYLQIYKNWRMILYESNIMNWRCFRVMGESSGEPQVKGAGLQLILFPQILLHPGLAFNPSIPWAGRLAHQPPGFWNNGTWRLASISPRGLGYL